MFKSYFSVMNKYVHLILILISSAFLMYISFYRFFRVRKNLRSKKISEKKEAIRETKRLPKENIVETVSEIGFTIFKHWL